MSRNVSIGIIVLLVVIIGGYSIWRPHGNAPQTAGQNSPIAVAYSCLQGKSIQATFVRGATSSPAQQGQPPKPTGSVTLKLSDGRSMTLPQTISGSGIRYANQDESIVFWSEGNGAFLLENNQQTYSGCVSVAADPGGLPDAFASGPEGFSIRYPQGYTVTEGYRYQEMGPGKSIGGVKFTIPTSTSAGTNLGSDTYLSVESIPTATSCGASQFLDAGVKSMTLTDGNTTYSFASSTGAGAGNRYEEWVYAIPGTNPCRAVRYFIHYSVIENYPPGTVTQFDQRALISKFDAMRRTLTLI